MDLSFSAAELAFRDEVRAFLADNLEPEWSGYADGDARAELSIALPWHARLALRGWLTPAWPKQYGGCDWTPMQHHLFKSECAAARAPKVLHMPIGMVGPLICAFGDEAQKSFYLPRIVAGTDIWCQGFSEPGAGSDLASLKTSARREGDCYVVDGQKIWTTYAHLATQMFALVRTDPAAEPAQAGIGMLLIDMSLPGIVVRPIRTIDGEHHFNEVFLDSVRVPASCLLGEPHRGWEYARFLLTHERSGIADVVTNRSFLQDIAAIAAADDGAGRQAGLTRELAQLEMTLDALEVLELRFLDNASRGNGQGFEASMLKVLGTELRQRILQSGVEALGELGSVAPAANAPVHRSGHGRTLVKDALFYRAASIYGGTNEIQRNLIARALLRSPDEI
jgi:alkylation response protein AidB-like acyl-CoA dehydrogenase